MLRFLLTNRHAWRLYALIFVGIIGFTFWQIKFLFTPSVLFGSHSLILMNENEARPCGGFITASGTLRILPPKINIQNVYNLPEHNLGKPHIRLQSITNQKKLWDAGTNTDPFRCSADIKEQLNTVGIKSNKILLINFAVLENIVKTLESIEINNEKVASHQLFAFISNSVANTDRHNLEKLQNRKGVLKQTLQSVIKKALLNPQKWISLSKTIKKDFLNKNIYFSALGKANEYKNEAFSLTEWNTGGGKSSRYLEKNLTITMREEQKNVWNISADIFVKHHGGNTEPLSQTWRGGFELGLPSFLEKNNPYITFQLRPGEAFTRTFQWNLKGNLPNNIHFTRSRGHTVNYNATISAFPQQHITSTNKKTTIKENVLQFSDASQKTHTSVEFNIEKDTKKPFLTLHQPILAENLPPVLQSAFIEKPWRLVELHFNEEVTLTDQFQAKLTNTNKNTLKNRDHLLIRGQTLLLAFEENEFNRETAFQLQLQGITDLWGNKIDEDMRWTIINR